MKRHSLRVLSRLFPVIADGIWAGRSLCDRLAEAADRDTSQSLIMFGRTEPAPGQVTTIAPQTLQQVAGGRKEAR